MRAVMDLFRRGGFVGLAALALQQVLISTEAPVPSHLGLAIVHAVLSTFSCGEDTTFPWFVGTDRLPHLSHL